MSPSPPPEPLDLLVIGAVTIDAVDDALAPGGSALYSTLAAAGAGLRVGVLTVAGPEPAAREGVARLESAAASVVCQPAASSLRFRFHYDGPARQLVVESRTDPIALPAAGPPPARAILVAPVGGELPAEVLERLAQVSAARTPRPLLVGSLQGWLRRLEIGEAASPIPLASLPSRLATAVGRLDVLVASDEDLAAEDGDARHRLAALRSWHGPQADLVLTVNVAGAWLDDGAGVRHIGPAEIVSDVPMIGAGDGYAAVLAAERAAGRSLDAAATAAAVAVSRMLAARR